MWVIISHQIKYVCGKKSMISFIEIYRLSDTLIIIRKANIQMVHAGSTLNILSIIPGQGCLLSLSLSLSLSLHTHTHTHTHRRMYVQETPNLHQLKYSLCISIFILKLVV